MSIRHVLLLTVLWAAARAGAGEPQPPADAGGPLGTDQLLRLIVSDVTANIRPLVDKIDTRIEGMDARLNSFDSRLNAIEGRLHSLDNKQSGVDARLAGLASQTESMNSELSARIEKVVSRIGTMNSEISTKLEDLTSHSDSGDNKLHSELKEMASQVNSSDSELSSRLEEMASHFNSLSYRLQEVATHVNSSDSELSYRLQEMASHVNSSNTELSSRLEEIASQVNSTDKELSYRLQEMVSQVNSSDAELGFRLDNLPSRVDALPLPRDCSELPPSSPSGIYPLQLDRSGPPVAAFCDQDTDGGGWTVFQRRADIEPRQDFSRPWAAYREGFGSLNKEFWWGLENLWRMTGPRDRQYQIRVDLADFNGGRRHAVYQRFRVSSEADGYRLSVEEYSGDAGDSLSYHNGMKFSSLDRDQDLSSRSSRHCAQEFGGGWWFKGCYDSHLNGLYLPGTRGKHEGVIWKDWRGWFYSLKETDMKLRPVNTD